MSVEIPKNNPEKQQLDDNARKFVVATIDRHYLVEQDKFKSYDLVTDWLETNEDDEKKLARKTFADDTVQILLISKVTKDGNRVAEKEPITEERYQELLAGSVLRVEKKRYEYELMQGVIKCNVKYDEFYNSELRILEIDADDDDMRKSFKASEFPYDLAEVTGQEQYYGYRVASAI